MKRLLYHLLNIKVGYEEHTDLESSVLFSKIVSQYRKNPSKLTICVRIDDQTREVLDKML